MSSLRFAFVRFVCHVALGLISVFALAAPADPGDGIVARQTTEIVAPSQSLSTTELAPEEALAVERMAAQRAAREPRAVLEPGLAAKIAHMDPMEMVRVIVYLDYLPHEAVTERAAARHAQEIADIRAGIREIHERGAARRRSDARIDAENYTGMLDMTAADRAALDALNDRNEAIGRAIMQETAAELRALLSPYRAPVEARITSLGGAIEFTTIAGSTIVARIPAGNVPELARTPRVMSVAEDLIEHSGLNISDAATMVDPQDTTLSGLWDFNYDGGAYDPAVVDSGLDLTHPGMADSAERTNFYSWYLTAGAADPNFADSGDILDRHGHGTHVSGIVASYGTPFYPDYLGTAYGVDKLVTLKAGWLNSVGSASMYASDRQHLIDRVLYDQSIIQPFGTFSDDIEGINISYWGETTSDETSSSRFIDSIVSSYADLVVTLIAGNSGPGNTEFTSPGASYNAITVANASDNGSANRDDDSISASSTRGPTADGRRKPDIAAHGSSIDSANTFWETQLDYVPKSGTSMAAPMALGVVIDLMDAGVFDEKAIKALLINTAQKNEPGIDIESDSDGWDPAAGWGLMNAYAAFFHRGDVITDTVTARGNPGSYHLYKGQMQDEGASGEGRDRATMVWNRRATYNTAAPPVTYYDLSNLNMRLYRESSEGLIDTDFSVVDNVHQVRINAGASPTDVVVKAYALDTAFDHGGTTESFALALEEGFVEVDLPSDFDGVALWPSAVEPNEVWEYTFWLRNRSAIASHDNEFELVLPAGWTLLSGATITDVGSIAGEDGLSTQVTWTLRAQPAPAASVNIDVKHRHNSYAEAYTGPTYRVSIPVEFDTVAPTPNPMTFAQLPDDTSISDIAMRAVTASDLHGPVQYYFDYTSSPTGGGAANDSGWITSTQFTDALLSLNHQFCYRVRARDAALVRNYTAYSGISCAFTAVQPPTGVAFGTVTTSSIDARSASTVAGLTRGISGLLIVNQTRGTSSGWKQHNEFWTSAGLAPNTSYQFAARARNGDGDVTAYSPSGATVTLANPPAAAAFSDITQTSIRANVNPNGNPVGTAFFIQNVTASTSSGWLPSTSWNSTGLACGTSYTFQARARNQNGIVTTITPLGVQSTAACDTDTDADGVMDAADNCTLVPNADQRDSNGDGFGNVCDPDLNNDNIVNVVDLGLLRSVFFTADADADFDGDGVVNVVDLGVMKLYFFLPPGPSGIAP